METFSKKYFKYIKAKNFLPDYCDIPYSVTTKHKMRGKDGNNKEIDFNAEEKKMIKNGVKKLYHDLK